MSQDQSPTDRADDRDPNLPRRPGEPPPHPEAGSRPDGGAARIIQGGEGGGADAGETLDDPGRGGD